MLKKWIVEPRLVTRMRIFQVSLRGRAAFVRAKHQVHLRNSLENEIGQRGRMSVVGRAHLNAQSDTLVAFLRQIKYQF